jgi:hypothetical protein
MPLPMDKALASATAPKHLVNQLNEEGKIMPRTVKKEKEKNTEP